jgi:uncharacterized protein
MKASKYNHLFQAPDGTWLMFNLLSKAFATVTPDDIVPIRKLLNNPAKLEGGTNGYQEKLAKGRFLVDDNADELSILKVLYNQIRFDNTRLHLVVFPTFACNFECPYCFQRQLVHIGYHIDGTMNDDVARALSGYVRKAVPHMHRLTVDWFGGEPLLALPLVLRLSHEFKTYCEDSLCTYYAQITSNGYNLTADACDQLARAGVTSVLVTLDGPARLHNIRRPLKGQGETFDTIIRNLKSAVEYFDRVKVRTNVDQENSEHLEELLDLLADEGLNRPKVSVVYAMTSIDRSLVKGLCPASERTFTSSVLTASRKAHELGFSVPVQEKQSTVNCWAITRNTFSVTPSGDVYKCGSFAGDPKLRDGYLDLETEEIRLGYNAVEWLAWDPFDDAKCRDCKMLPICFGGCPYNQVMAKLRGAGAATPQRSRVLNCVEWNTELLELALLHEYNAHKTP